MKKIFLGITISTMALTLHSCCTKKECIDYTDNSVEFHHFEEKDLDSIYIFNYAKTGGFVTPLDSQYCSVRKTNSDYFLLDNPMQFKNDQNYKIKLFRTGKEYFITDFQVTKKGCNSCFPSRPKSDFYEVRTGYRINGELKEGKTVIVNK